ncbi:hypothetical protein BJV77DRAFT_953414 [Russula vinacea]|nr:hypothetical protein BJV77DRAFT_953414 [Russula vinacea]
MFSKSFVAPILLLALTSSVNAQACISPALGVSGTPDANNVQKPSDDAPCGTINIAQNIDSSTPLAPEGGYYYPSIINYEAGADGSQSIATVKVDPTGAGSNFVAANIITNGPSDPTKADSQQQLKVKLPDNTECTGGANKNRCLVLFTTTAGYGNCVVFPNLTRRRTLIQSRRIP